MGTLRVNDAEALRYLGVKGGAGETLRGQVRRTASYLEATIPPKWVWKVFPLHRYALSGDGIIRDGGGKRRYYVGETSLILEGETAESLLAECSAVALLACTLGAAFDTLLRHRQARDMAEAVILDACGSAWVEAGCDRAEEEISERFPGLYRTDRFSPGYGDLPLSLQRDLLPLLDAQRRLGLTVTEQYLLNPAKSVTALLGLSDIPQRVRIRGCGYCSMREHCSLRKEGRRCGI